MAKNVVSSVISLILSFAISIAILVLAILISKKKHELELTEMLQKDILSKPIFDLQVIDSNKECISGTYPIPFGTYLGKDFTGEDSQRTILKWKGIKLCGVLSQKFNDYKSLFKYAKEKCSSGENDCGQLDMEEQHLCLPSGEQCPVNSIEIKSTDEGSTSKQLNDGKYFIWSNQKGGQGKIFYKFEIADETPCLQPGVLVNKNGINGYHNSCPYFKKVTNDNKYYKIDSSNFTQVLQENSINLDHPFQTNLYVSTYMGFDKDEDKAEKNIEKDFYDKNKNNLKKGKKCAKALWILALISLIIGIIKDICNLAKGDDQQKNVGGGCIFVLGSLCGLAAFILAIIVFAKFNKVIKIEKYVADFYEDAFEEEYKNYRKCWKMALACMILELSGIAVFVLVCFCACGFACFDACLNCDCYSCRRCCRNCCKKSSSSTNTNDRDVQVQPSKENVNQENHGEAGAADVQGGEGVGDFHTDAVVQGGQLEVYNGNNNENNVTAPAAAKDNEMQDMGNNNEKPS